MQLKKERIQ